MEYVDNRLVLRLKTPVADAKLRTIQRDFADILTDGDFRQELDAAVTNASPNSSAPARLIFHFNRRSLGRLRQLIDSINSAT